MIFLSECRHSQYIPNLWHYDSCWTSRTIYTEWVRSCTNQLHDPAHGVWNVHQSFCSSLCDLLL